MPNIHRKLVGRGVSFTDAMTTTPLCCPSRAGLITGQYAHNNGVFTNFYPKLKKKKNVLPVWLQNKGYRTVHVGKFMNGYWPRARQGDQPRRRAGPIGSPGSSATVLRLRDVDQRPQADASAASRSPTRPASSLASPSGVIRKHFRNRRTREQPLYLQADYFAPARRPRRRRALFREHRRPAARRPGRVRGRAASRSALVQRGRRQRQALLRPVRARRSTRSRSPSSAPATAASSRRLIGVDNGAKKIIKALAQPRRASQHGRDLPRRQRLLLRRAPPRVTAGVGPGRKVRAQGRALRGGIPGAARDAGPDQAAGRRSGARGDRRAGREHRHRAHRCSTSPAPGPAAPSAGRAAGCSTEPR